MAPGLWLATSALLRALSGPVDGVDSLETADVALEPGDRAPAGTTAGTPAAHSGSCRDQTPTGASIRVADEHETGERLVASGLVLKADGRTPAPGMTVYVYHADAGGRYALANAMDNQHPRLCGILRTDASGRWRVETIRPGAPVGEGAPHIHFVVWGERQERRMFLLLFDTRNGIGGGTEAAAGDRHATTRPLVRDAHGVWHCVRDLRL